MRFTQILSFAAVMFVGVNASANPISSQASGGRAKELYQALVFGDVNLVENETKTEANLEALVHCSKSSLENLDLAPYVDVYSCTINGKAIDAGTSQKLMNAILEVFGKGKRLEVIDWDNAGYNEKFNGAVTVKAARSVQAIGATPKFTAVVSQ